MSKMCPVVHFEMPYEQRERMANFYQNAFGWQTEMFGDARWRQLLDDHDSLTASREFMSWAVNDAIKRGELTTDTDVHHLVEMLVAVMWGMGFYAGFVGNHDDLGSVVHKFELLMANKLWHLHE